MDSIWDRTNIQYRTLSIWINPKTKGLIGIITKLLIQGDFKHLINNSIPLLC